MEGLVILIAIYVLDVVIKKVLANKKENRNVPPKEPRDVQEQRNPQQSSPSKAGSLQDLIRQFEEAQRQASQGTLTPETPPIEDLDEDYEDDEDEVDLPTVTPANPNRITFREIAESVIQWEEVSVEYLQEAFGFSEGTAQQVLAELQAHHIVGRDMGEGFCDLLVHDKTELENLFKREQREAEELQAAQAQEAALHARREAELKHQQELAELEERARQLREQAGQINDGSESIGAPCLSNADHRRHTRSFNKAEIRRGFVWAKVLDEPRFKKKWNSRIR
ncbi:MULTISPECIES: hypothetical protein [unclassified Fibrobacter]|uniref:hypothetical protein n=1 Tax=unclassified Fibrobacter TaxID=2634177 RepID=UPI000D6D4F74|nr:MULTISPECIES: hypothetical protein [unclassified Fibrobacter]PWJ71877.1 hypothetical protein BGX12_101115 [Fibrobacter sp. UWR4]PZW73791.1 hypothetical protein C8E88_1002114 [Fibrobacter sp. UWR1]